MRGAINRSALAAMLLTLLPGIALAEDVRLALVVGSNTPQTPDLARLSYADDDAVRTSQVLDTLGFETVTLADGDADSKRLYPDQTWESPTKDRVVQALANLVDDARSRVQAGDTVAIYFVFAGHGSYDAEGRGFLHLADGKFTLRDLFSNLIYPTDGLCNVVVVLDSCNAEFLVKPRGSAVRRPAGPTTLRLEDYDHVGLILSSSATGEVREWGRFLGGVFSHQVRSALLGGADQDCDGRITFPELAAFLEAANDSVSNPQLRLTPYVRAPLGDPGMVVAAPGMAQAAAHLSLDTPRPLRLTLLDPQLVRTADLNLNGQCPKELVLVPGTRYTVVMGSSEKLAVAGARQRLALSELPSEAGDTVASRGTDEYLRNHLFDTPFGPDYYARFVDGPYQDRLILERDVPLAWYENPWGWAGIGVGAAAATAATLFLVASQDASDHARQATWSSDISRYNNLVDSYNLASGISWGVAAVAFTSGVLVFLMDDQWSTQTVVPQFKGPVVLLPNPEGLLLEVRY